MICYKLTNKNNQTLNATQWGRDITHETSGDGGLCGPGWLHAYTDPLLAVLLNPIHGGFENPNLWLAEGSGEFKDDCGLKIGFTKLTTIRRLELPVITTEQRVRFAILCAKEVCKDDEKWMLWADKWLSGENRSLDSAYITYIIAKNHSMIANANTYHIMHALRFSAYSAYSVKSVDCCKSSAAYTAEYAASNKSSNINLIEIAKLAINNVL